jgi:hypothetical protein
MIGEIVFIDGSQYVKVNDAGTLEHLKGLSQIRQLQLWFMSRVCKISYSDVKEFHRKHGSKRGRWYI